MHMLKKCKPYCCVKDVFCMGKGIRELCHSRYRQERETPDSS